MKTSTTTALLFVLGGSLVGCGTNDPCDPTAPNSICTIAGHSADEGYAGDGGQAIDATLYIPMDSTVASNGEVWFIDFNNYVVRVIGHDGSIRTVIGNGELGDSPAQEAVASIPALDAFNNHTTDLFFAGDYLYLAAWHNSRVKRVHLTDMMMEDFAGTGARTHYSGDGGPATMADFDLPSSIARDDAGDVIVMDQGNQVVRKIDGNGVVTTIAGQCIVDADVPCAVGQTPTACPDSNKLTCGDPATECPKQCTPGYAGDGGPAALARFNLPYGQAADPSGRILYDHAGNLLISDTGNNRIRKVDPSGVITTIAGTGVAGSAGDGVPATQAQLNHPVDIAVADDNSIYFTDVFNNCVRKIDPAGIITTVVGQCSSNPADRGFAGDGGPPTAAKLDRPYGLDLQGKTLYVSDSFNNRLRIVNLP